MAMFEARLGSPRMERSCQGSRTWLPESIESIGVEVLGHGKQKAEDEDNLCTLNDQEEG